jgi:hypothetical protein
LEDLVARIDVPSLDYISITFFHRLIFDVLQLSQLMRRTTRFQELDEAHVKFVYRGVQVESFPRTKPFHERSGLRITCRKMGWELLSPAQILTSFFLSIYIVENFYIYWYRSSQWGDNTEDMEWLEIFRPFTAVKGLYVCKEVAQCIASALVELVEERVADVLPALESFLENLQPSGPVREAIGQLVCCATALRSPHSCFSLGKALSVELCLGSR